MLKQKLTSISIIMIFLCLIIPIFLTAQPDIEWEKTYGGSMWEWGNSILQTDDEGYIMVGKTASADGDTPGIQGNRNLWIVKLDKEGELEWQKKYGGSGSDEGFSITATLDGGYVIAGETYSSSGDVSNNYGDEDIWILKIDSSGEILWEKNYGGTSSDNPRTIQLTSDNGFIISGSSWSTDFDLTTNNGFRDWWILKLSETGNVEWQKSFGGASAEIANAVRPTIDGGFICAGFSNSFSGDFNFNYGAGEDDAWLIKLDSIGNVLWKKNYGGSLSDNFINVIPTPSGAFIAVGYSESSNQDVTTNRGGRDLWVIKITSSGEVEWSNTYGGSQDELAVDIKLLPNSEGFLITGNTSSNGTGVLGNNGAQDIWILKLNEAGVLQWSKNIGGSLDDTANSTVLTNDGGFIITGNSESNDFDVSNNQGISDLWVIKFPDISTATKALENKSSLNIFPNPSTGIVNIEYQNPSTNSMDLKIRVYDTFGKTILEKNGVFQMSLENLPKGFYLVEVQESGFSIVKKLFLH